MEIITESLPDCTTELSPEILPQIIPDSLPDSLSEILPDSLSEIIPEIQKEDDDKAVLDYYTDTLLVSAKKSIKITEQLFKRIIRDSNHHIFVDKNGTRYADKMKQLINSNMNMRSIVRLLYDDPLLYAIRGLAHPEVIRVIKNMLYDSSTIDLGHFIHKKYTDDMYAIKDPYDSLPKEECSKIDQSDYIDAIEYRSTMYNLSLPAMLKDFSEYMEITLKYTNIYAGPPDRYKEIVAEYISIFE
jgi:hypothetical protein